MTRSLKKGPFVDEHLRKKVEQMKAAGHPDMLACLLDEPDHEPRPARRDYYNKVFALVEKGAPEVPVFALSPYCHSYHVAPFTPALLATPAPVPSSQFLLAGYTL